jgi:uncharacterized protein DUF4266
MMRVAVLLGLGIALSGCVSVQPWERGIQAKRCMQINPDPTATAFEQHVFEYREGSSGGYETVGGSGCGCN